MQDKKWTWSCFEIALPEELEPGMKYIKWHHTLLPHVDLFGAERVYSVGLEALEYPPTWANSQAEADIVESALTAYIEGKITI